MRRTIGIALCGATLAAAGPAAAAAPGKQPAPTAFPACHLQAQSPGQRGGAPRRFVRPEAQPADAEVLEAIAKPLRAAAGRFVPLNARAAWSWFEVDGRKVTVVVSEHAGRSGHSAVLAATEAGVARPAAVVVAAAAARPGKAPAAAKRHRVVAIGDVDDTGLPAVVVASGPPGAESLHAFRITPTAAEDLGPAVCAP